MLAFAGTLALARPMPLSAEHFDFDFVQKGKNYVISIDTDEKKYAIKADKPLEMREAQDVLAGFLLEEKVKAVKKDNESLEVKLEDVAWKNPSLFVPRCEELSLKTMTSNMAAFAPYQAPFLNMKARRRGNNLDLSFCLDSQQFLLEWYKDCGITLFFPADSKIRREYCDKVILLDPNKKDKFGIGWATKTVNSEGTEVANLLFDAFVSKVLKKIESVNSLPGLILEIEDKLAQYEKESREGIVEHFKEKYDSLRYIPGQMISQFFDGATFHTFDKLTHPYEIGRTLQLSFEGKPKKIYLFVNTNVMLNPLVQEKGTATCKSGALLKLWLIEPAKFTDETAAGQFLNGIRGVHDKLEGIIKDYEKVKKKLSLPQKVQWYDTLNMWDTHIVSWSEFLEQIAEKQITSEIRSSPEYAKFKQTLDERVANRKSCGTILDELSCIVEQEKKEKELPEEIFQNYVKRVEVAVAPYGKKYEALKKEDIGFELRDLNSDGSNEVIITEINHPLFCGATGNSTVAIWQKSSQGWKEIFWSSGRGIAVLKEKYNNYNIVSVGGIDYSKGCGADSIPLDTLYGWDGSEYVQIGAEYIRIGEQPERLESKREEKWAKQSLAIPEEIEAYYTGKGVSKDDMRASSKDLNYDGREELIIEIKAKEGRLLGIWQKRASEWYPLMKTVYVNEFKIHNDSVNGYKAIETKRYDNNLTQIFYYDKGLDCYKCYSAY